nr:disease resistance protein RPM1-like [Ipomoea trifida]
MAEAAVTFLLDQLSAVIRDECSVLGGIRNDAEDIKNDLSRLRAALRVADEREEMDPQVKAWVKIIRELAYDTEDVLDEFLFRFGGRHTGGGLFTKMKNKYTCAKNLRAQHRLALALQKIKARISENSQYQPILPTTTVHNPQLHDGRVDALFQKDSDLVGFENPKQSLIKLLLGAVDDDLRVHSVVGMGGLGKTTLVKKAYDDAKVKKHFQYRVWVTVSETFKIEELLKNAIKQLVKPPHDFEGQDSAKLIESALEQNFAVILTGQNKEWSDDKCRRLIIHRFDDDILKSTSSKSPHIRSLQLYNYKVLVSFSLSKLLSFDYYIPLKVLDLRGTPLKKIPKDVFKLFYLKYLSLRCTKLTNVPKSIQALQNLEILDLKYTKVLKLPVEIGKLHKLLNLIVSFKSYGFYAPFEIGRLLFLQKLSYVQAKKTNGVKVVSEIGNLTQLRKLGVTHLRQEDGKELCSSMEKLTNLISLSLDTAGKNEILDIQHSLSTVPLCLRTLKLDGRLERIPQWLSSLVSLTKLELQNSCVLEDPLPFLQDLPMLAHLQLVKSYEGEGLCFKAGKFPKLKFLGIYWLRALKWIMVEEGAMPLLEELCFLGCGLLEHVPFGRFQNLETLDLKWTSVTELPTELLQLCKLRHLLVYNYGEWNDPWSTIKSFSAPFKIGELLSLQKLCFIKADDIGDSKIVSEIGKLTQLRRLAISNLKQEDAEEMCLSLEKLTNLCSLSPATASEDAIIDIQHPRCLYAFPGLRSLYLGGCLERVPQWLSSLEGLTRLNLVWNKLPEDPLPFIQDLPMLTYLEFYKCYETEGLCFKKFSKLKIMYIRGFEALKWIRIEEGALANLARLHFSECELLEEVPLGIQHLSNMEEISFYLMADKLIASVEPSGENYAKISHIPNISYTKFTNATTSVLRQRLDPVKYPDSLSSTFRTFLKGLLDSVMLTCQEIHAPEATAAKGNGNI